MNAIPRRCPVCGSVFLAAHRCGGLPGPDQCRCGHPKVSHHLTAKGTRTWCSVWDQGGRCSCEGAA